MQTDDLDEIFEKFKDESFEGAKTVSEIPKLAAFQRALRKRRENSDFPIDLDIKTDEH